MVLLLAWGFDESQFLAGNFLLEGERREITPDCTKSPKRELSLSHSFVDPGGYRLSEQIRDLSTEAQGRAD